MEFSASESGNTNKTDQNLDDVPIDDLTLEEQQEKEELLKNGAPYDNWSKKDFSSFIKACSHFGREDLANITKEMEESTQKTSDDTREYATYFWKNYKQLSGTFN